MIKKILVVYLTIFCFVPFQIVVKSAEIDATADKLVNDYKNNIYLASTVVATAGNCIWNRNYEDAELLLSAVNDTQPNTVWGTKARLGLARLEILELLGQKEYAEANQRVGAMIAEFQNEPDLEIALFHAGQEFFWQRQFGEAKDIFDRTVELFPDSPNAEEIQLWSAKTGICTLIYGRRATDEEIVAEIDKLINNFKDNAGLPEAVYWIGKEYEWAKGQQLKRAGWYDAPNSAYQRMMQEFGDSLYSKEAEWDQKRLAHRMKIFNLMKENDQNAIDAAIEEMVADLQGRPETAGELYWIACGYEEKDDEANNKGAEAMRTYERIVQDFPESKEADKAVLDIQKRIITDSIIAGDINGAEVLMDEFAVAFKDHPYAGTCLGRVAFGEYKRGYKLKEEGQRDEAKQHYAEEVKIFERIKTNNLKVEADDVYLYFYSAISYHELARWEDALDIYYKILDDWPRFKHNCNIKSAIGWCYRKLRDSGKIPKEQADSLIEDAYTAVLADSYECYAKREAAYQLAQMSEAKGDKVAAVEYYRIFLEEVKNRDWRVADVKAKIAELELEDDNQ